MWTGEHTSGCLTVKLESKGGITTFLAPLCSVDLGTIPDGVLMTSDGRPIMTADGYYIIVPGASASALTIEDGRLMTSDGNYIFVND